MTAFASRMLLAAKLDPNVYEEIEADRSALSQSMAVVILSSVAAGIGSSQQVGINGLLAGTVMALLGWIVWAAVTYVIGTRLLPEPQTRADYGEMLRTIGFASAPGILRVLGVIPGAMTIVFLIAGIWMLVAMVIAVRQALDYRSTWRAVGVCLIGWIIQSLILLLVMAFTGAPAPPTGAE